MRPTRVHRSSHESSRNSTNVPCAGYHPVRRCFHQNISSSEMERTLELWGLVRDGGALAVLGLAVLGAYRGWWVPGWLYRAEQERGNRLERLAWSLTTAADKAVSQLERRQEA